jgi:hypothetical protein
LRLLLNYLKTEAKNQSVDAEFLNFEDPDF